LAGEIDVQALFERLREEIAARPGGNDAGRARTRALAERFWPVSAERPLGRGTKAFAQRVLRKLMRWYVEPLAAEQRTFNDSALKLIDDLSEVVDRLADDREAQARLLRELDERLTRAERRDRGQTPAPAAPPAPALPDYFGFASRMRPAATVRAQHRPYVELFREAGPVLDLGCGRGELLQLLGEAGIEARGVDSDADMVAFARGEGLAVEHADLLGHLERLKPHSVGGIFAGQVVEHLPPPALYRFLELAAAKLRPGGILVAETINPLSPIALRQYFADITHAQPLVPETLELLARQAGFAETEIRYSNEPDDRLQAPDDAVLAKNVALLNELLYGPLDYALVART
jgi:SAM-dependent methyltransferase